MLIPCLKIFDPERSNPNPIAGHSKLFPKACPFPISHRSLRSSGVLTGKNSFFCQNTSPSLLCLKSSLEKSLLSFYCHINASSGDASGLGTDSPVGAVMLSITFPVLLLGMLSDCTFLGVGI